MQYRELISNEYYSLSELFATPNRKIIIPDFQRDFCWGDQTHGVPPYFNIVSSFLDTLIEEFKNNKEADLLIGKIDVYEHPKNHIYLTDGQQRLTTLYLLIGMLYRNKTDIELKEKLKDCLISSFEDRDDDKEPYLQYAVRESTIFFLRDLVSEFFIGELSINTYDVDYLNSRKYQKSKSEELLLSFAIKRQPWYFSEYDLDPSIKSMLLGLGIIEEKLKQVENRDFSEFVIQRIKIQYYDVMDKKSGEERFVIINTTGKSLTVAENIKPILLGSVEDPTFAIEWEERETFFWQNRNKEKENIADNGVNEFLNWCFQIIDKQDEFDIIKKAKEILIGRKNNIYLTSINGYYKALNIILKYLENDKYQAQFKFINDSKVKGIIDLRGLSKEKQQNVLLPLLSFINKFGNQGDDCYHFLRRLRKNYFDQKWKKRNTDYVDWRYVLQIIEKSKSLEDILNYKITEKSIHPIQNIKLNKWFNEEEKIKSQLVEQKELLERWEDHVDFMGDLSTLFKACLIKKDDSELPKLDYENKFEISELKKIYLNYESTIDLIRSEEAANANIQLANIFRLFRFFIGCDKVAHIYKASWDFEGVLFSTLNREHLHKLRFLKLIKSDDLISECVLYVKGKVKEEELFNFEEINVKKLIKAWLTLKVFQANSKDILLSFHDRNGTGVAAYTNMKNNKLIDSEEFSIGNSICGFGVRSGFGGGNYVSTTSEDLWCNTNIIDTPFSDIAHSKEDRKIEQIEGNQKTINDILTLINQ